MKKKLLAVMVAAVTIGMTYFVASCNKQILDFNYKYNYAYIQLQNGEVLEGRVETWQDYEGEQLQVKINGVTYLTNSYNCTLIYNPALD